MAEAYFYIISRPDRIHFECPYCDLDVDINWKDVDAPKHWSDDWGEVECPYCNKTVKLGEWQYD